MKKKICLMVLFIVTITLTGCGKKTNKNITNNCKFDGEMVQGAEYVNGQYTYHYMERALFNGGWASIKEEGWGVVLTDKKSTAPVSTQLCSTINGKPIVSMSNMFKDSEATSVDLSSFNTSNVTNMEAMFYDSKAEQLDVSTFDTSNVTNMYGMFRGTKSATLDLRGFDTSKVVDMENMFAFSKSTSINISSFNTSNVENMKKMFYYCHAESLDVSKFNVEKVSQNSKGMSKMFCDSEALKKGAINYGSDPTRFGDSSKCGLFD